MVIHLHFLCCSKKVDIFRDTDTRRSKNGTHLDIREERRYYISISQNTLKDGRNKMCSYLEMQIKVEDIKYTRLEIKKGGVDTAYTCVEIWRKGRF